MKYLLDSNIIIALVMNLDRGVVQRAAECFEGDMVTSAIAFAEVAYGAARAKPPAFDQLQAFVQEVPVLAFDYKAAQVYATLPFRRAGYDRLIAAHALSHASILVTHNAKHFDDVPGLCVEDWTT